MTAEKAASLTSSLLARKGAAKPAALDQDVYRSVTLPTGQAGPTAVVTTLHPPREDAGPAEADGDDGNDAGETEAREAAPEAALTDLRVAVEARSGEANEADRPDDADVAPAEPVAELADPGELPEPAAAEISAEPPTSDASRDDGIAADEPEAGETPVPDDAASVTDAASTEEPATQTESAPDAEMPAVEVETPAAEVETPPQPEPTAMPPIAATPSDRLAAAEPAAPEGRRGRTLVLSAAIFVLSAVIGWYTVQQSPSLQAEFQRLAGQFLTLIYGPAEEAPAAGDADDGAAMEPAPAPSATEPVERTTPPAPERGASDDAGSDAGSPAPQSPLPDKRDSLAEVAAANAATPPAVAPAAGEPETAPSIDLVRISPAGDGIIVGRAAPDAELILLDNGQPIGTVTATPAGEWVFQTEEPLPGGEHNFGVVVKKAYGNVTLPSPSARSNGEAPSAATPADEEQGSRAGEEDKEDETSALVPERGDEAPPVPLSKPGSDVPDAATVDGRFVIQLASVKSTAHAERLWAELREDFPELTDGLNLIIDSRRGSNAYVRVRTGPFVARANAESYCARFKAGNQDCLVVVALPRS